MSAVTGRRPLVAVPPHRFGPGQVGEWPDRAEAVPVAYLSALRRAGAIPVALGGPVDLAPDELLAPFDGLLLIGGPDVDPALYHEVPHLADYGLDPVRDALEADLALAALELGLPLLAVCRGLQLLNAALGGTLWQHLPELGGDVAHGVPVGAGEETYHEVAVAPGSRLAKLAGGADRLERCISLHHQGVRHLAEGLVATAYTADGLVEAAETPPDSPAWCVAVQWHPERSAAEDPAQQAIFDGFVAQLGETAPLDETY